MKLMSILALCFMLLSPVQADLISDAEQIMDEAQIAYPDLFPSSQLTLTSEPYLYRFYPVSGIYLGVNLLDSGVYLLGGRFGNTPFYVDDIEAVQALLQQQMQRVDTFDSGTAGSLPDGWQAGITGFGDSVWKLVDDVTAPSTALVLKQSGEGDYPWCVKKDSQLTDGFVSVKIKPLTGGTDQAAGLIWRWKDADNYYVARANALENNISIYYVEDGRRITIRYADVPTHLRVRRNVWQNFRVDFEGDRFKVSFQGEIIIDIRDQNIKGDGRVGLWTKEDSVTSFDNFIYAETPK